MRSCLLNMRAMLFSQSPNSSVRSVRKGWCGLAEHRTRGEHELGGKSVLGAIEWCIFSSCVCEVSWLSLFLSRGDDWSAFRFGGRGHQWCASVVPQLTQARRGIQEGAWCYGRTDLNPDIFLWRGVWGVTVGSGHGGGSSDFSRSRHPMQTL